jgi:hypothetical protein
MLRGGMTPEAALRAAQSSVRRRPEWRSPYYWAAFTTQGEFREAIGPRRAPASDQTFVKLLAGGSLQLVFFSAAVAWWYRLRRLRV